MLQPLIFLLCTSGCLHLRHSLWLHLLLDVYFRLLFFKWYDEAEQNVTHLVWPPTYDTRAVKSCVIFKNLIHSLYNVTVTVVTKHCSEQNCKSQQMICEQWDWWGPTSHRFLFHVLYDGSFPAPSTPLPTSARHGAGVDADPLGLCCLLSHAGWSCASETESFTRPEIFTNHQETWYLWNQSHELQLLRKPDQRNQCKLRFLEYGWTYFLLLATSHAARAVCFCANCPYFCFSPDECLCPLTGLFSCHLGSLLSNCPEGKEEV